MKNSQNFNPWVSEAICEEVSRLRNSGRPKASHMTKVKQSYLRLKAIFSVGAYWSGGLFQGCQPIVDQVQVT